VEVTVTLKTPLTVIEGNEYCYGTFGNAGTWMTENLRVTQYDGSANLLTLNNNATTYSDRYYAYPYDLPDNKTTLGLLYTWSAATDRTGVDADEGYPNTQSPVQGICPFGWHLPTDTEWTDLEKAIASADPGIYSSTGDPAWDEAYYSTFNAYRGTHGHKITSTTAINSKNSNGTSLSRDDGGFDALLVGFTMLGSKQQYGLFGRFWTASNNDSANAWARTLNNAQVGVWRAGYVKNYLHSVRCKQD
jgi:uncharacterized protein (TIGR02145 family)